MESWTRTEGLDGRRDRREPKRERSVQGRGHPEYDAILALQRAAGNAAVASLLGGGKGQTARRRPPQPVVVQRNGGHKRKAPEPQTFASDPQDFEHTTGVAPAQVRWTGARPQTVRGSVVPSAVPSRGPTAIPQAYLQQDQDGKADTRRLLGFDGGHVIGLHLGGVNVGENVVPMYPGFNRGVWKNMEDQTKQDATRRGHPYRITITLSYGGGAPEVPTSLTVVREFSNPSTGAWEQALPPATFSQPGDIPQTARLSGADERTVNPRREDPIGLVTQEHAADQFETGGLSLKDYLNSNKSMPPSKKAMYPDDPGKRPYGLLDVLTLNGTVALPVAISSFRDFSEVQRTLILQTNMARNGGRIMSDDPADPHRYLDERGAANFPEVDHIIPKSLGGSNAYSNARVVSWELNNKLARVKPLSGLVALKRLALPTLPGRAPEVAKVIVEQYLARRTSAEFTLGDVLGWANEKFSPQSRTVGKFIGTELTTITAQGGLVLTGQKYALP